MKLLTGVNSKDHENAIEVLFQTTEWEIEELSKEDYRHRKNVMDILNRYKRIRAEIDCVLTSGKNLKKDITRQERRAEVKRCRERMTYWVKRIAVVEAKAEAEKEERREKARKVGAERVRLTTELEEKRERSHGSATPSTD